MTARHADTVKWDRFCRLYEFDEKRNEELKELAKLVVRKGADSNVPYIRAKEFLLATKEDSTKSKVKKSRKLLDVVEHAVKCRAENKTLRRMKFADDDEDEAEKA